MNEVIGYVGEKAEKVVETVKEETPKEETPKKAKKPTKQE